MRSLARMLAYTALVTAIAAAPRLASAQAQTVIARFGATTVGLNPGSGEVLDIDLFRWSSEDEVARMFAAFTLNGDMRWNETLKAAPTLGYVWVKGDNVGYAVRYAQRITARNGEERVVLATDQPVGKYRFRAWKAAGATTSYSYSVLELRVNGHGRGSGTASFAARVVADPEHNTIALDDSAPVLLTSVTRQLFEAAPAAPAAAGASNAGTARATN